MKKYLLGLFAIATAIAFVAFTAPVKVDSTNAITYFRYSPNVFAETDFETSGNWTNVAVPTDGTLCPGSSDPCIVQIEASHLSGVGTIEQKFAAKLLSITPSTPYLTFTSASAYVNGRATDLKN